MLLLPATITHRDAHEALRLLAPALRREPEAGVVIDASALAQFDSAALAVLLECKRLAEAWGRPFAVQQAPPKLAQLAQLYGIDDIVALRPPALTAVAPAVV